MTSAASSSASSSSSREPKRRALTLHSADALEAAHINVGRVTDHIGRLLVRLPNWLGDVVMAAPTVAAIHRALPDTEIVAQVKAPFMPLAALLPGVTKVVPAGRDKGLGDLFASRRALKELEVDAALIFPRSLRSALAPWLARIPVRVGYDAPGRRRFLTHPLSGWRPLRSAHRSTYFASLADAFGADVDGDWSLAPKQDAVDDAERLLLALGRKTERPLVVLEPGASYGAAKCWPAEKFGDLARALTEDGSADVVTVGTEATRPIERIVAQRAPGLMRGAGRTDDLSVLIGLLSKADVVVSNDTGPMHVAAAVGAPVLALFGASDPVVSSPIGPGTRKVIYEPEPCSPCFLRTCPVEGHPCLSKIGVERVEREVRGMIA